MPKEKSTIEEGELPISLHISPMAEIPARRPRIASITLYTHQFRMENLASGSQPEMGRVRLPDLQMPPCPRLGRASGDPRLRCWVEDSEQEQIIRSHALWRGGAPPELREKRLTKEDLDQM